MVDKDYQIARLVVSLGVIAVAVGAYLINDPDAGRYGQMAGVALCVGALVGNIIFFWRALR